MTKLSPSQIAGVTNAGIARSRFAQRLADDVARFDADIALAWDGDADAFFGALGDEAAAMWAALGQDAEHLLAQGADYAALRKPSRVCLVCADGHVVPSAVPFPPAPLAVWHIPSATKADALALLAQGESAILSALIAAQPAQ